MESLSVMFAQAFLSSCHGNLINGNLIIREHRYL